MTSDDLWPHFCSHLQLYLRIIVSPSPMKIQQKTLAKRWMTPRWHDPILLRSNVHLYPRIIVSKSHENISKYKDTVQKKKKKVKKKRTLTKRPVTPIKVTFDPFLLTSYVRLYPKIVMSTSHANTSKYMMIPFFKNFNKRVNDPKWPLGDLWPQFCWGHMFGST